MNAIVRKSSSDARDLIDLRIEEAIPGIEILEHLIVEPYVECSIKLDNPDGQLLVDRVLIPIQKLEGRIVRLPPHLKGSVWLVVYFAHIAGEIVRGRPIEQWKKLWEDRYDFDVFMLDGREYFEQ